MRGTLQTHVTLVLTSTGMKRKSKAPCRGMANILVDIRGDALGGFADTSGGALSEMRSDSGNYHATQAVRITLWHTDHELDGLHAAHDDQEPDLAGPLH